MWESVGEAVTVPLVEGMSFRAAQEIASAAGVTLANPDPDGPPIGALAWGRKYLVLHQTPPAGTIVTRHSSVAIRVEEKLHEER